MKPLIVLTTVGENHNARDLAATLVEKRVAACVNILPNVFSVYRWRKAVEHEHEQILVIKTTDEKLDALRDALFARHPYDVPEFVVLTPEAVAEAYGRWLAESVTDAN
jgi:periplasmic divalent cation tolerance protein